MLKRLRNRHFFFLDLLLLPVAAYVAFVLRLERFRIEPFWPAFFTFGLAVLVVTPSTFRLAGIYSRYWRYASIDELLRLIGTVTVASVTAGALS